MRIVYYEDKDFVLKYEIVFKMVFLHCEVFNWKLSVLKKLYKKFASLSDFIYDMGYRELATLTPNPKFAKLFGGKTEQHLLHNNQPVEYIKWELRQLS